MSKVVISLTGTEIANACREGEALVWMDDPFTSILVFRSGIGYSDGSIRSETETTYWVVCDGCELAWMILGDPHEWTDEKLNRLYRVAVITEDEQPKTWDEPHIDAIVTTTMGPHRDGIRETAAGHEPAPAQQKGKAIAGCEGLVIAGTEGSVRAGTTGPVIAGKKDEENEENEED